MGGNYVKLGLMTLIIVLSQKGVKGDNNYTVGVIEDYNSRVGKERKVAMEIAIEDVYYNTSQTLILIQKHSPMEDTLQAALAAKELINTNQVQVILGPQTWQQSSLIAEITTKSQIPFLSFSDETPAWAPEQWPYLIQASPDNHNQTKAIAAIIQSNEWHQVTVIYDHAAGVIPHLSDALQEMGNVKIHLLPLPPVSSTAFSGELQKLKTEQNRVFVTHLSFPATVRLFETAKNMGMMEKDYVWITTDIFTNLVHSMNSSNFSSMQGVLGVKSYFPENGSFFHDFNSKFQARFKSEFPEEQNPDPGIFAIQAYDAIWTVARASMEEENNGAKNLLDKILSCDFDGLSGKVKFFDGKMESANVFQIINVVGKSYKELGFWSNELGFSEVIGEGVSYDVSMKNLWVFWPGGPLSTPRGWDVPTNANPLRICVPTKSGFKDFVDFVDVDGGSEKKAKGFSIDVFEEVVKVLPYDLSYKLFPFGESYDELVEQVDLKKYDAAIGDISIVGNRYEHAEFTYPYADTGLWMIVPVRPQTLNKPLLFLNPFTVTMWFIIASITIYNGFAVFLIERNHCPELQGSLLNRVGIVLTISFTTLFSLHAGQLHHNLTRLTMVVWLFVSLIVIQTYTANLASILTVKRLEPTITDIKSLQHSDAMVGYCSGSYVATYLNEVLDFKMKNLKDYGSPEAYHQAFATKEIEAAFLEVPYAKLFLAKYCHGYTSAGPTYKVGGFGFVFPRGSPFIPDVTKAILNVSESGKLLELERKMLESQTCSSTSQDNDITILSPSSFWVPFLLTGGTTTIALTIYFGSYIWRNRTIWKLMVQVTKHWRHQKRFFSRKVGHAETPPNNSNPLQIQV